MTAAIAAIAVMTLLLAPIPAEAQNSGPGSGLTVCSRLVPSITAERPGWAGSEDPKTVRAVIRPGCASMASVSVSIRRHDGPPTSSIGDTVSRPWSTVQRVLRSEGSSNDPAWDVTLPVSAPRYRRDDRLWLQWRVTYTDVRGTTLQATSVVVPFQVGCTPAQQAAARGADQAAIQSILTSDLLVIGDGIELARLGAAGWPIPTHGAASFSGMGVAFLRGDATITPGVATPVVGSRPDLLFFAPATTPADTNPFLLGNQGTFTDGTFDFPLTLVGWAYARLYAPGVRPSGLNCVPFEDWFIHERGEHPPDGSFVPRPPIGEGGNLGTFGQSIGEPLPIHSRLWDLHVWRGTNGNPPQLSILHPTRAIPGFTGVPAGFFYTNDINHDETFVFGPKRGNRPPLPPQ